ncbi:MAG: hypothetical protein K2N29_04775 [Ruminiclostridium sp.]|nr:hypothetical protein [Ruminiclostridium sp.]
MILFCAIAVIVVGFTSALAFLAYGKIDVYREISPSGDVEVLIRGGTGFFEFTPKGGFDYELIVSNQFIFFGTPILKKEFHFNADGAPLKEDCVQADWFEDHVEVEIDNKQHQVNSVKRFVCYF